MRPEDLYDVVEPATAVASPLWWLAAIALVAGALVLSRRWRRRRWQRAVRQSADLAALSALLKQCATDAGHPEVAPLWGDAWWQWLTSRVADPAPLAPLAVIASAERYAASRAPTRQECAAACRWLRQARLGPRRRRA